MATHARSKPKLRGKARKMIFFFFSLIRSSKKNYHTVYALLDRGVFAGYTYIYVGEIEAGYTVVLYIYRLILFVPRRRAEEVKFWWETILP